MRQVSQPAWDILVMEKPDLNDYNLPMLQAYEKKVLNKKHEAASAVDRVTEMQ